MNRCILSMLAFCVLIFFSGTAQAQFLLIKNSLYLNPETLRVEPVSVLIHGDKVAQVDHLPQPLLAPPANTHVIDAKGALLLPGMIDMHTHSWGNSGLRTNDAYQYIGHRGSANALLYAGVHGALDLFADEEQILNYRDSEFPRERDEAWIFAAGPCFTVTDGHCSQGRPTRIIDSPADVEKHLTELAKRKPDVVKVVLHGNEYLPTIDETTLAAFLTQATSLGLKSIVHVGSWQELRMATKHGASAVTHIPWKPMPEDIPELMAKNKTVMIPTVGLIAELFHLQEQTSLPEHIGQITKTLVAEELLAQFPVAPKNERYQQWLSKEDKAEALYHISQSLIALYQAGVTILPGSDAANEAMYQGVGLHRELAHLQAMGLPTEYLLNAVTHKAYEFLDLNWGVAVGTEANFILVNPAVLNDINFSADFAQVILQGRIVDRNPLLKYAKPDWWQYTRLFLGLED